MSIREIMQPVLDKLVKMNDNLEESAAKGNEIHNAQRIVLQEAIMAIKDAIIEQEDNEHNKLLDQIREAYDDVGRESVANAIYDVAQQVEDAQGEAYDVAFEDVMYVLQEKLGFEEVDRVLFKIESEVQDLIFEQFTEEGLSR